MAKITQKERVQQLTEQMNGSIKNYQTDPQEELKLLRYLRQFNNYSVRNIALIQDQYEGAYGVESYKKHKENGYQVQKGEKAIRILAPRFQDIFKDENNREQFVSRATKKQKEKIKNSELEVTKDKLVGYISVPVFDITQTNAPEEDYPKLYPNKPENFKFNGNENEFKNFKQAIYDYADEAGVKVQKGKTDSVAKGYYSPNNNHIVLRDDLSEKEETKVLLHELAHGKMHNANSIKEKIQNNKNISTPVLEYQAEMTAYVVSSTFELDTEDYSQKYLSNWTEKDIDNQVYIDSLKEVKDVSMAMIEIVSERYQTLSLVQENDLSNAQKDSKSYQVIAEKLSFLTDKNGENRYKELENEILKPTRISIEKQGTFDKSTIELNTKENEKIMAQISTQKVSNDTLNNWEKGLTGKQWLDENLQAEVVKRNPEKTFNQPDLYNENTRRKLQDIQSINQNKEQELEQSL